jgi:hypothetical protein
MSANSQWRICSSLGGPHGPAWSITDNERRRGAVVDAQGRWRGCSMDFVKVGRFTNTPHPPVDVSPEFATKTRRQNVSFSPITKRLFAPATHHAASTRAPLVLWRSALAFMGHESHSSRLSSFHRLPSASIDTGGLTLMDIERDARCDLTGNSRANVAGPWKGRSEPKGYTEPA